MYVYLELQIDMRPNLIAGTPLGTATYDVVEMTTGEWADDVSHETFPAGDARGAYPSGLMRHRWTNRAYQVHIWVDWTATWHLAGGTGALGGAGHDVDTVIDEQLAGHPDPDVLAGAVSDQRARRPGLMRARSAGDSDDARYGCHSDDGEHGRFTETATLAFRWAPFR